MTDSESEKILIVDDDEGSRRSLSLVLGGSGYRTIEAATASEGLERAEQLRPALVLLDVKLPDLPGSEVLARLRRSDPDLPVVLVTAYASLETAIEAVNKGASGFMVKPVNVEEMLLNVRQLLERRRLSVENRRLYQEIERELEERRRAEAERDLLVRAIDAAGEAIVVTDAEGAVLYVNRAFEWITGYSAAEVTEQGIGLLDPGHGTEKLEGEIEEKIKARGVWSGQLRSRRKNGELYLEEATITPVTGETGEVINLVHVRRDVSEKKKLEAIAAAVNTMNNIGYVFSGIRHELGNPINSARMTLKMLQARLDTIERADLENYIERVLDALSAVGFLLHSLKSFNMFEDLRLKDVELPPFMEQFLFLVRSDSTTRGVAVSVDLESPDLTVRADPRALQQVLLNVFTNALDACADRDDGRIEISARRRRSEIVLRVDDNGIGISEDGLENLFKPFVTDKPEGTGLGLVISRNMMSHMDGAIDVSSERGKGTRVELTLPEGHHEQPTP